MYACRYGSFRAVKSVDIYALLREAQYGPSFGILIEHGYVHELRSTQPDRSLFTSVKLGSGDIRGYLIHGCGVLVDHGILQNPKGNIQYYIIDSSPHNHPPSSTGE